MIIYFEKILLAEAASVINFTNSSKLDDDLVRKLSYSGYGYSDFKRRARSLYPDIGSFTDQKSIQKLDGEYEIVLKDFEFKELERE